MRKFWFGYLNGDDTSHDLNVDGAVRNKVWRVLGWIRVVHIRDRWAFVNTVMNLLVP
jgi:hypothetical protein